MADHVIRTAVLGDAVMLHLLAAATYPMAAPGAPQEDIILHIDAHLSVERFREYLRDEDRHLYIAEVNGTPAGYAMLNLHEQTDPVVAEMLGHSPSVELSKFYLLAGRHGSGLADDLLRVVLDDARDAGAASVWLGVHDENDRPNHFYDRHDFTRRGLKTFQIGTFTEPDLIREKTLWASLP